MTKARIIFLTVGIIILILLFKTFGVETTLLNIKKIGWRFLIILSIFLFSNFFFTCAWRIIIPYPVKASLFYKFFLARIAGDSTTSVSSIGGIAGEPLKAMYVKDIIPFKAGLATVVLDRMIKSIANMLMVLTGILISLFILNIPLYISIITLSVTIPVLISLLIILRKQNDGFIEYIICKMPKKIIDKILTEKRWEKVRTLDEEIKYVFSSRDNLHHFYTSLFIHYTTIIISSALEIYLIVLFMQVKGDFSILHAMFIYVFGFILTSAMFFMPANVGTSEGSYSLALSLLGYDPALGFSIGIVRRLRTFVWAAIGILLLFYAGLIKKEKE